MIKKFPIHPFVFALYPVLALLAFNIDQLRPASALRAAGFSLLGSAVLFVLFWRILSHLRRAALLTSFWLLLFFTYGHIYQLIEGRDLAGWVFGKHRFLMVVWLILLVTGSYWIVKILKRTRDISLMLNVISLALVALPLVQIVWFGLRFQQFSSQSDPTTVAAQSTNITDQDSPDIYYIILDSYNRSDVMQQLYGLDITPTLNELKSMGFVIPDCTQSNYGLTALSMYASLNMEYLDEAIFPLGSEADKVDYQMAHDYLRHSKVRQTLAEHGYQMVTFETGYYWLDIDDADLYIVQNNNPLRQFSESYEVSNFETLFSRTTALRILTEANVSLLQPLTRRMDSQNEHHYAMVKFTLDHIKELPEIPGKKFVYVHLLAPHDPYVFAPDGSFLYSPNPGDVAGSDIPGYTNEVRYLNSQLVEIVRTLIEKSETPPIIILQSDHGSDPRSEYHMRILNAYYLPGGGNERVYPNITPVNTFRLVLNHYFDEPIELLPDQSYFSMGSDIPMYGVRSRPYQLTPIPSTCAGADQ